MIVRLANYIADQFEEEKYISHELREHYVYALITMIERIFTLASIIGLGLILKEFAATIIFLLVFMSLRIHTGGYHAKESWQCYLESLLIYILVISLNPVIAEHMRVTYVCLAAAVIYIYKTGTINHPNMAMDYYELAESKKAARRMIVIQCGLIMVMSVVGINERYVAVMSMAVILCAALMLAAKIKKQEVSCNEAD